MLSDRYIFFFCQSLAIYIDCNYTILVETERDINGRVIVEDAICR